MLRHYMQKNPVVAWRIRPRANFLFFPENRGISKFWCIISGPSVGAKFTFMATLRAKEAWFPKIRGPYVSYLRDSERPYSRLDSSTQREAITALLSKGRAKCIAEMIEAEPLVAGQRPELEKAIALCKEQRAVLVFGKLDRMRGGMRWLEYMFERGIKFRAADLPHLYSSSFYKMQRDDSDWRRLMSHQVKLGLLAAKQRGATLGGKRESAEGLKMGPAASALSRQRTAFYRDREILHQIERLEREGITSLTAIATQLNEMGHKAPRGGNWSPAQIRVVIKRNEDWD